MPVLQAIRKAVCCSFLKSCTLASGRALLLGVAEVPGVAAAKRSHALALLLAPPSCHGCTKPK